MSRIRARTNPSPAFFFDTAGAEAVASQSEAAWQRRNAENNFASAEATKGAALGTRRLLKKAGENFHPAEVIRLGEGGRKLSSYYM